jgi:signal transduction histidine kinase
MIVTSYSQPRSVLQLPLQQAHARSLRHLALLFGIGAILVLVLNSPPWPGEHGWALLALTTLWAALWGSAYQVADRWPSAALALLVVMLPCLATAAAIQFQSPALTALALLSPLLAIMLGGLLTGLIAGIGVALLITMLAQMGLPLIPSTADADLLYLAAAVLTLTSWIVTRELADAAVVATQAQEHAQRLVEEARSQRLELRQAEEDLLQANREQIRLLNRLEALNQIAEEARQAKQTFITNVSHELRTPLNMIIAYAELITQAPHLYGRRLPPTLLADMNVILRNSQHLSRLVDDVLDLSQIEMGRMALNKEWADVEGIIEMAAEAMRPLFQTKGIDLVTEVDADLPELYCDRTRVRQVIINLLSNAGRFTEQGSVKVCARRDGAKVVISVVDTGPGIEQADQQRLFEPFQQLDSSIRRKHGGSGLGLNISKHFVDLHDGRIWLESQIGAGTTFYVSLPLDSPPNPESAPPGAQRWVSPFHEYTPRTRPRVANIPHVSRRYVVLDGGSTLPRLLNRYVADVEIIAAAGSAEALAQLSESPAHALIVNTSSLTDDQTLATIPNRLPFDTPLFACQLASGDSLRQQGIVNYLVKPVAGADLLHAVRALASPVRTVLVADDEPDLLRLFTRILSGAPERYRVISSTSGLEALELLREHQPDLLILDLVMPQMSGFDLLKTKEGDPSIRAIPVIVVSSRDPNSQPIVSNQLLVMRGAGFSIRDLLDSIDSLTTILAPAAPRERREPPATPVA